MPFPWEDSPWWQESANIWGGIPPYVPAIIAQQESSGRPDALGDFLAGYDPQGNPQFSGNPAAGPPTSFGLFQLHGSQEWGSGAILGQGSPYPQKALLDPRQNVLYAAPAIIGGYQQASTSPLPAGYAQQVAAQIGATPPADFLLLARTAQLSGHTIPVSSLWQGYQAYGGKGPQTADNVPNNTPSESGLKAALISGATQRHSSDFSVSGALQRFGVGLAGIIIMGLLIWAGINAWRGTK